MNYKKMIIVLHKLHKKTGWSYYKIIKDIIECAKKYQAGYMDYDLFEMYNMSSKERETVLTRGKNNELIRFFNQKDKIHFFHNKDEFNQKFQNFLNRDYLVLNDNEKQFSLFLKKKKKSLQNQYPVLVEKELKNYSITVKKYIPVMSYVRRINVV